MRFPFGKTFTFRRDSYRSLQSQQWAIPFGKTYRSCQDFLLTTLCYFEAFHLLARPPWFRWDVISKQGFHQKSHCCQDSCLLPWPFFELPESYQRLTIGKTHDFHQDFSAKSFITTKTVRYLLLAWPNQVTRTSQRSLLSLRRTPIGITKLHCWDISLRPLCYPDSFKLSVRHPSITRTLPDTRVSPIRSHCHSKKSIC